MLLLRSWRRHPSRECYSFVILSFQLRLSWFDSRAKDSTAVDRVEGLLLSSYYGFLQSSSQLRGRQSCRVRGLQLVWTSPWSGHQRYRSIQWKIASSPRCSPSKLSFRLSAVTLSFCITFLHLYFLALRKVPKSQFTASKGATSFSYETLIGSVSWAPMGSSRVGLKLLIEYYVVL